MSLDNTPTPSELSDPAFVTAFMAAPVATLQRLGVLSEPKLVQELTDVIKIAGVAGAGLQDLAVIVTGNSSAR